MVTYLIFISEKAATHALATISRNMKLPTKYTLSFAEVQKAYDKDIWYFVAPEPRYLVNVRRNYYFLSNISSLLPPKEQQKELSKSFKLLESLNDKTIKQQKNEH